MTPVSKSHLKINKSRKMNHAKKEKQNVFYVKEKNHFENIINVLKN